MSDKEEHDAITALRESLVGSGAIFKVFREGFLCGMDAFKYVDPIDDQDVENRIRKDFEAMVLKNRKKQST